MSGGCKTCRLSVQPLPQNFQSGNISLLCVNHIRLDFVIWATHLLISKQAFQVNTVRYAEARRRLHRYV